MSVGGTALFVSLLAAITFAPSVANGFVYDDVRIVVDQTQLHSLSNVLDIISAPWWSDALYRPVTKLSFAVDWTLSGGAAWYFHAVNVLLHTAATLAVFFLALRWLGIFGATVGAAVFAVHPVHVEAVTSIVGRAEVMVGLFAVVAALSYRWDGILASYDDRSWRRYVASGGTMIALVLGLGSKENALAIPGLLLIVDWLEARLKNRRFDAWFRRHWVLWVATLLLCLEWMWLRAEVLGGLVGDHAAPGLEATGLSDRIMIMAPVVLQYVRLFVWPQHLSADYSPDYVNVEGAFTAAALAGLTVLAVAIVWGMAAAKRAPIIAFGLLWMAGGLLIVTNIVVPTGVILAERTLYLPSIGLVFIGGYLATMVPLDRTRVAGVVLAGVIAVGMVRSAYRIPVFKNDESFYPRLVADAPGSFRSLWLLGNMAYMRGDRNQGERLLRDAIVVFPLYPNVWRDLGLRLQEDQRWAEAAQSFSIAFKLDTTRVYDAAGAIANFVRSGNLDSAKTYAARAVRIDPFSPQLNTALASIAAAEGRLIEAMTYERRAAWYEPEDPMYWYSAALSALDAAHCPFALVAIRRLNELDDQFPDLGKLKHDADSLGCRGENLGER